jgi:hypothetical protein
MRVTVLRVKLGVHCQGALDPPYPNTPHQKPIESEGEAQEFSSVAPYKQD